MKQFHKLVMCRLVVAVVLFAGAISAHAQVCGLEPSPVLRFSPATPDSSQVVTITVGDLFLDPISVAATVNANTIDVVLTTGFVSSTGNPVPVCVTVGVGPLLPGLYTVNYYQAILGPPQLFRTSKVLTVTQAINTPTPGSTNAASTLNLPALAILALVLAGAAMRTLRDSKRLMSSGARAR